MRSVASHYVGSSTRLLKAETMKQYEMSFYTRHVECAPRRFRWLYTQVRKVMRWVFRDDPPWVQYGITLELAANPETRGIEWGGVQVRITNSESTWVCADIWGVHAAEESRVVLRDPRSVLSVHMNEPFRDPA